MPPNRNPLLCGGSRRILSKAATRLPIGLSSKRPRRVFSRLLIQTSRPWVSLVSLLRDRRQISDLKLPRFRRRMVELVRAGRTRKHPTRCLRFTTGKAAPPGGGTPKRGLTPATDRSHGARGCANAALEGGHRTSPHLHVQGSQHAASHRGHHAGYFVNPPHRHAPSCHPKA